MNKTLISVIIVIIILSGLVWFLYSDNNEDIQPDNSDNNPNVDNLSADGRTLNTDDNVFSEIDEALGTLD